MSFKAKFRLLRQQLRLSQTELAELLGVTIGTVSRYESGSRKPSVQTAARIMTLAKVRNIKMDLTFFK